MLGRGRSVRKTTAWANVCACLVGTLSGQAYHSPHIHVAQVNLRLIMLGLHVISEVKMHACFCPACPDKICPDFGTFRLTYTVGLHIYMIYQDSHSPYNLNFGDFSVNFQPIYVKFYTHYFLVMWRLP